MHDNQMTDIEALIAEAQKRRLDAPQPSPPHFHGKPHGRAHKPRKPRPTPSARYWRNIERAAIILPDKKKPQRRKK